MITHLLRLHEAIVLAGVVIEGVDAEGHVTPTNLQSAAQPIIDAFVDSTEADATWVARKIKAQAVASIDHGATKEADLRERIEFALVNAIRDEFNRHSDVELALFNAVADATGGTPAAVWADFQARVAAIPRVPQRSLADLGTVIKNAIDGTPE